MINEKQIQKAIREVSGGVRKSVELRDPGRRGAGRLALAIRPIGKGIVAEWYAVYYRAERRVKMKLGSYPQMTIAAARSTFFTACAPAIAAGADPAAIRRSERGKGTVRELLEAYVEHLERAGRPSARAVRNALLGPKNDRGIVGGAAKDIGPDREASSIAPADIVPHLAAIHARGAEVNASRTRAYLCAAFNWGLKSEHDYTQGKTAASWGLKSNPVAAIPNNTGASRPGQRFLSPAELRTFWLWLVEHQETSLTASAMMLRIATGQRSSEILRITRDVYEPARAMLHWDKTKNDLPHSIPLPHQAVAVLDRLLPNKHGLYFPHTRDETRPGTTEGLADLIQRFLRKHPDFKPFAPRDIRRTWKTLAGDAGIPKEMRDRLQNHVKGDISSRHYDRYDYLLERRAAMAKWAAYLDLVIEGKIDELGKRESNVVPMAKTVGEAA